MKKKEQYKIWVVKRVVEEKYEVSARNKQEAMDQAALNGDPHAIKVIKETAKLYKRSNP